MIYKAKKSLGLKTYPKFARAKKALGQNFLKSNIALNKIIESGEIKPDDIILEIGPGKGVLTSKLLEKIQPSRGEPSGRGVVIAVEKDRALFEFLKTKFEEEIKAGTLVILNEDILEFDFRATQSILERTLGRKGGDGQRKFSVENFRGESENTLHSYKIIANIPYNITGAILKKFLTAKLPTSSQPERMVLMVQHEVAKRIIARPRHGGASTKESLLSISVKAYGEPELIMKVPARYFSPAPKVDSAVILIKNISRKLFLKDEIDEEKFWKIVKLGFAHKRKKLSSNLKGILTQEKNASHPPQELFLRKIEKLHNKRAEDLSLSDWVKLIS